MTRYDSVMRLGKCKYRPAPPHHLTTALPPPPQPTTAKYFSIRADSPSVHFTVDNAFTEHGVIGKIFFVKKYL